MLFVKLLRSVVSSVIVFPFCKIAIGELGILRLTILVPVTSSVVTPSIGFKPVASDCKSVVNVIGNSANCVTTFLSSLPILSNLSSITFLVSVRSFSIDFSTVAMPLLLNCAASLAE